MKNAKELIDLVLDTHGGVRRWNQLNTVKVQHLFPIGVFKKPC